MLGDKLDKDAAIELERERNKFLAKLYAGEFGKSVCKFEDDLWEKEMERRNKKEQETPKEPTSSAMDTQVGGDHYKKLGDYQPWEVLQRWLTPEEFHGYMKGSAIAYLAREKDKGGLADIKKAAHTLQALIEIEEGSEQ